MKAKLIALNLNATKRSAAGKTLKGVEVTYQGEPYKGQEKEPTTRFLFTDNPVAVKLGDGEFRPGDWVEITFDNDKFKTPNGIRKIEQTTSAPTTTSQLPAPSRSYAPQDENTQKRITRAVAIKEATALISLMASNGAFAATKLKSAEFLTQQIIEAAKMYEPYLSCSEESEDVEQPNASSSDDFDQEPFE